MRLLLIAFLSVALPLISIAQNGSVSGRVTNADEPVPFANIILVELIKNLIFTFFFFKVIWTANISPIFKNRENSNFFF